jgi:TetR/AcrR family transcriptional repressor of nem operon
LDKAMKVFWSKGYSSTSIEDLVRATGVSRHGLYGEFESKRGLFLACLDRYQDVVVSNAFGVVEKPGASLDNIHAYFAMIIEQAPTARGSQGCLMTNTATDVAPYDKRAANKVEKFRTRLRTGFATALRAAKADGKINLDLNVEYAADFLTGVTQGLSVMVRSRADPKTLANVVAVAMSALQ